MPGLNLLYARFPFAPIAAELLFAAHYRAIGTAQPLLTPLEAIQRFVECSVRQRRETCDSDVDADCGRGSHHVRSLVLSR